MTEESLFQEALSRPPAERAAFLDAACAGNPGLRAAVEALLAAYDKPGNMLDRPPAAVGETIGPQGGANRPQENTTDYEPRAGAGSVIAGRYTLVEKIGEGGMGEVWVAKQSEPVKRRVAVKLIKAGMDSRAVVQRFEQERQALAMMDHPNIAKVLDGGLTHDRRPFFVMELVNGLPLTKFCDEAKLGIRERLELFTPICQAVQHAHQKGIIHRDLKPSNILVTIVDGRGVPKVIDFGVAKATSGRLTDESLSTQFGAVVGTLEYMSPEQAGFSGTDIDTRADVYSLGVILYELLTGLRPLDARRLKQAAFTEMIRVIKEEEPSKPSTRLSSDASAPSLAALRLSEPKRLAALLRGELDWVVMKCLEKQRDRRYETASGLARDIQRYLANELVEARPPSARYRLQKFVRRNRAAVTTAVVVSLAIVAGAGLATWQAIRATNAETQSRLEAIRATDAEAQSRLEAIRATNAEAQSRLDRDRAEESFRQARAAVDDYFTTVSESKLLKVPGLKPLRKDLMDRALKYYQEFVKQRHGDESVNAELGRTYYRIARIATWFGKSEDGVAAYEKALQAYESLVQAHPEEARYQTDLAIVCNDLGNVLRARGRREEALRIHRRAMAIRAKLAEAHPDLLRYQNELSKSYANVGYIMRELNQDAEALESLEKALAINQRILAAPSGILEIPTDLGNYFNTRDAIRDDMARDHNMLGHILAHMGRHAEAMAAHEKAVAIGEQMVSESPDDDDYANLLGLAYNSLGFRLNVAKQHERALTCYERGRELFKLISDRNPTLPGMLSSMAWEDLMIGATLGYLGRDAEALKHTRAAVAIQEKLAAEHPTERWTKIGLATGCLYLGRSPALTPAEARAILTKGETTLAALPNPAAVELYNLACMRARLVPLANGERDQAIGRALDSLRRAIDAGYRDVVNMASDVDLESLRQHDEFKKLLADVRSKVGDGLKRP
jgi:serine/threonine protein kinase